MNAPAIPIDKQVACLVRELKMRASVYPRWVAAQRITQEKADYEIECMRAALATLREIEASQRLI